MGGKKNEGWKSFHKVVTSLRNSPYGLDSTERQDSTEAESSHLLFLSFEQQISTKLGKELSIKDMNGNHSPQCRL